MREILFKAKRINNDKWIEGYYFYNPNIDKHFVHNWLSGGLVEVDKDTICQYTGLTDKNGKKVFIGDIVKCSRGCPHEVIWLEEYGGTYVGGMPAIYLSGLLNGYAWTSSEEVIGNIFDNPELISEV